MDAPTAAKSRQDSLRDDRIGPW